MWAMHVPEGFVQPGVVEPDDPLDGRELELGPMRQTRSAISSVLKLSTKLSAIRVVVGIPDRADRGQHAMVGEGRCRYLGWLRRRSGPGQSVSTCGTVRRAV